MIIVNKHNKLCKHQKAKGVYNKICEGKNSSTKEIKQKTQVIGKINLNHNHNKLH